MKVGLFLYNPATKQAVDIVEIGEDEESVDFLLKDAITKSIHSAAEILGVDPMQVMTNPDLNRLSLRLKIIPGIHEHCGKPWGECTCGIRRTPPQVHNPETENA
jgi:hypothetical protein